MLTLKFCPDHFTGRAFTYTSPKCKKRGKAAFRWDNLDIKKNPTIQPAFKGGNTAIQLHCNFPGESCLRENALYNTGSLAFDLGLHGPTTLEKSYCGRVEDSVHRSRDWPAGSYCLARASDSCPSGLCRVQCFLVERGTSILRHTFYLNTSKQYIQV